jgi:Fe-S-cluster containining protein
MCKGKHLSWISHTMPMAVYFKDEVMSLSLCMDLNRFKELAKKKSAENKKFLQGLKRKEPRKLDETFHTVHEEVFEEINCLNCANCCKTTSPIFYENDIERLAKNLKMKPGDFVQKYLRIDEDNDYVLQSSPCPFLDGENYCVVYEDRPKACREYPHTDRKKMYQVLDLASKNTMVCPAVFEMVERLKKVNI